jgi:hypothetical protein
MGSKKVNAIFKGKNGSCGYETNKEYTLIIKHQNNSEIQIERFLGGGCCEYSSMVSFLENWDNINLTGKHKIKSSGNELSLKLCWNDPEKARPKDGQQIIFNDLVGFNKGTYYALGDGVVRVNDRKSDSVAWSDILEWITHPISQ